MTAIADRRRAPALVFVLAVAASIISVATARPGEVADRAAEAEALLQSGDPAAAFDALDGAVDAFWAGAPLTLRRAQFVADDAPRPEGPFRSGESLRIRVEPLGYGFREDGGVFHVALTSGIEIRTQGGIVLARTEDFGRLEWSGRTRSREVPFTIGVGLPELRPGGYALVLTLTDEASGKAATATLSFAVAE